MAIESLKEKVGEKKCQNDFSIKIFFKLCKYLYSFRRRKILKMNLMLKS